MTANELPHKNAAPSALLVDLHENQLYKRIRESLITDTTPIKRLPPVITIGGTTFARRGDFSVVSGQRKAGKTTILRFIAATALLDDAPADLDTLQIRSEYCQNRDVVYVDTEGSKEDTHDFIASVKTVMGVKQQPKNFYAYGWREFSQKDCRKGLEYLFEHHHPTAHIWIIDGIADLVSKPNDEEESNETVRWIMHLASKHDTCIILVIHENPNKAGQESKLRGHLGSELERKSSGAITVEKDKQHGEHYIKSRFLRKSADFEPIAFRFDPVTKQPCHRILSPEERARMADKNHKVVSEAAALRDKCFGQSQTKAHDELHRLIVIHQGSKPSKDAERVAANRSLKKMIEFNLIDIETTETGKVYHIINARGLDIEFGNPANV